MIPFSIEPALYYTFIVGLIILVGGALLSNRRRDKIVVCVLLVMVGSVF